MIKEQIKLLLSEGEFPEISHRKKLVETHISWVILCDEFVYKIKKPVKYPFLNFSTIALRKHFCEREIELNRRMSKNLYLEVLPVTFLNERYYVGHDKAGVIDYAVKMRKLNPEKQMDVLLANNKLGPDDIKNLAECIATFHKGAKVIYNKRVLNLKIKFNELEGQKEFISENLNKEFGELIDRAIEKSDIFLNKNLKLLEERLKAGLFRDCHGDLHTRNIFLLPAPQPFDCVEFNDEFRQIDVLNEVAFLCMDLDAMERKDLSNLFIEHYNFLFPTMKNRIESQLFIYYKSYRANIRAKVNSLRAFSSSDELSKSEALKEAEKYLKLMESYMNELTAS
jgi:hypothetical protein